MCKHESTVKREVGVYITYGDADTKGLSRGHRDGGDQTTSFGDMLADRQTGMLVAILDPPREGVETAGR